MMKNTARLALVACLAAAPAFALDKDDDPPEYRDRAEVRDAYRRGYERGFERGYDKGMREGEKRPAPVFVAPPAPKPMLGPIRVSGAFYGNGKRNCDATRYMGRLANGKRSYSVEVTNDICGDPARGDRKQLDVTYWCGEVSRTATAFEHRTIYLDCN